MLLSARRYYFNICLQRERERERERERCVVLIVLILTLCVGSDAFHALLRIDTEFNVYLLIGSYMVATQDFGIRAFFVAKLV